MQEIYRVFCFYLDAFSLFRRHCCSYLPICCFELNCIDAILISNYNQDYKNVTEQLSPTWPIRAQNVVTPGVMPLWCWEIQWRETFLGQGSFLDSFRLVPGTGVLIRSWYRGYCLLNLFPTLRGHWFLLVSFLRDQISNLSAKCMNC